MAYSSWNGNLVTRPAKGIFGRIINLLVQVRDRADSRQDVFVVPATAGGDVTVSGHGGNIVIDIQDDADQFVVMGDSGGRVIEMRGAGSLGLYGATPVTRPGVAAGASVADLITALDTTGIINKT